MEANTGLRAPWLAVLSSHFLLVMTPQGKPTATEKKKTDAATHASLQVAFHTRVLSSVLPPWASQTCLKDSELLEHSLKSSNPHP